MKDRLRSTEKILQKLGIKALNEMQKAAAESIADQDEVVIISPTGSGKTLAFLLPIIEKIDPSISEVQALIVTPTRELALQIEQVAREMGTGLKINAFYGGRPGAKDKEELTQAPALLIGTPGRLSDHLSRESFITQYLKTLVLDEFDKSLEIGFTEEMKQVVWSLTHLEQKILTSATPMEVLPSFLGLAEPTTLDFSYQKREGLEVKILRSEEKDKLPLLGQLLERIGQVPTIIFCNFKDSINRISEQLSAEGIEHACFYGGLEQHERERALIKFRNGSAKVLLATDLAARGIDVAEIQNIIHYHLPLKAEEYIHRNGRTARMHSSGRAWVLLGSKEVQPDFIEGETMVLDQVQLNSNEKQQDWTTIFLSGGRKDKISKGDIAGFLIKEGKLEKDELGIIELKQDCAFVAINASQANRVVELLNNRKLKKRKLRVKLMD